MIDPELFTREAMFYAVRNTETGEFLEVGGKGSIWSHCITLQAMSATKEQASTKMHTLEKEERKQSEIVGVDVTIKAVAA